MSNAFVLYVDHQGHPAPLTECFHATASRRLSSTSYRYPVATSQDVDSAYCPQCLTFHDATTAAELGYCSKPTCRRCPLCLSVASINTANAASGGIECFFQCGLCTWTSKDCRMSVVVPSDDVDRKLDRLELLRAAEEMNSALADRRKLAMQPWDSLHQTLSNHWKNYRTQQRKHEAKRHDEQWSLELLEAKVQTKAASLQATQVGSLPSGPLVQVKRTSIQDIVAHVSPKILTTRFSDDLSLMAYHLQAMDAEPLLPLPIPLSLRQSRRCRAELADGRPGILLKPKLNPLEGDSSLPTGHGQWFRKDSSAIHVIPRVRVVQRHETKGNDESSPKQVFLLKVSNPTLGTVRLRLSKSTYAGEKENWNDTPDDATGVTSSFTGLLVDTISQSTVRAELKPWLTQSIETTETVELASAEDSIIELGGKSRRTPDEVLHWSPSLIDQQVDNSSSLRLVAQSASDAWFELIVQDGDTGASTATAIPLALEVDLGNGSWESSLIPVVEGATSDKVLFDLVCVWT